MIVMMMVRLLFELGVVVGVHDGGEGVEGDYGGGGCWGWEGVCEEGELCGVCVVVWEGAWGCEWVVEHRTVWI